MKLGDMYRERELGPPSFVWYPLQNKTCVLPRLSTSQVGRLRPCIAVTCGSQNALPWYAIVKLEVSY